MNGNSKVVENVTKHLSIFDHVLSLADPWQPGGGGGQTKKKLMYVTNNDILSDNNSQCCASMHTYSKYTTSKWQIKCRGCAKKVTLAP